jgi:hypothetical protein
VVSVICRSPLIHIEVEFKLSLAPLSRHGLTFEQSGQELTQYLDSTSVTFAAPARWARTPHNQHRCNTPGVTQGVHPGLHHLNLLSHVGLVEQSTSNLEFKVLSKCNPSWISCPNLSCTSKGENCPKPKSKPLWTMGTLDVSRTKRS